MQKMMAADEFPKRGRYAFYYPEMSRHQTHGELHDFPATIEVLCSPYMIIKHKKPHTLNLKTNKSEETGSEGFVIYYNRDGSTEFEFMYFLDTLSRFQILRSDYPIKVRVAYKNPDSNIKSDFAKAKNLYVDQWGSDDSRKRDVDRIDFELVTTSTPNYIPGVVGWRED